MERELLEVIFGPTTGLQGPYYYLGPDYRPLLEMSQLTQK